MSKDPLLYIEDIVESILAIQGYVQGVELEAFLANAEKQDAVLRRLAIIGEAVKKLPNEFRAAHPKVPWRDIAASRDVLIHDYDRVNLHLLWDIIHNDLPPLLSQLRPLLNE
ncbi:MAG: DUF86 domain-containing protein [Desulfarculus sp.]|jgi:uncharacterized protein with HEPN domain|nr:MAG: DUF86 domain-containing protein [Desulfarculus sp.]